jgi:antitoxin VapB
MSRTAKLFSNGRSQAVRLPVEFRFEGTEVFISQNEATGDVLLSRRPKDWAGFLELLDPRAVDKKFLSSAERKTKSTARDAFAEWME